MPTVAIEQLDTLLDPGPFVPAEMAFEETAMVLYTRGRQDCPRACRSATAVTSGDRRYARAAPRHRGQEAIIAAPLFHMNGLFSAKLVMMNGGTIALMTAFTARGYIRAIDRLRIDMVTSVPTMLALVMRETEALATADLGCVTVAVTGSARRRPSSSSRCNRLFPNAETANSWAPPNRARSRSARIPRDRCRWRAGLSAQGSR